MSSNNNAHPRSPLAAPLCPTHRRAAGSETCLRCGSFLCAACLMESRGELRCSACIEKHSPPVDSFIPGESAASRWGGRGLGFGALGGAALAGVLWTLTGRTEALIPIFVGPLLGALGGLLYGSLSKNARPVVLSAAQAKERREREKAARAAFLREELSSLEEAIEFTRPCAEHPERDSRRLCMSCQRAACEDCLARIEEISGCWDCRPPAPPRFELQAAKKFEGARIGRGRAMVALITFVSLPFILILASVVLPASLTTFFTSSRIVTFISALGIAIALASALSAWAGVPLFSASFPSKT